MAFIYRPDPELRRLANRQPHIAQARKRMADSYRQIRKTRPEMARLLFRRIKRAEQAFVDDVWSQGASTSGGLFVLVK